MCDFRNERIGTTNAARLLGVSVTDLKSAVQQQTLLKGIEVPQPLIRKGGHYQWLAGEIMDCAENLKKVPKPK